MNAEIYPSQICGEISVPPSKSISHRAIICAALASGESFISPICFCDDVNATIEAVKQLGAIVTPFKNGVKIFGISGLAGISKLGKVNLLCNESGSTLRFLIPMMSLTGDETRFLGSAKLLSRPQTVYTQLFFGKNITFNKTPASIFVHGKLFGGKFMIKGDISSQFITGMMFALPMVDADSSINVIPPFCSKPYVQLSADVLNRFGVKTQMTEGKIAAIKILGKQEFLPTDLAVEGDWSQLAFFAVSAAIRGSVICKGVNCNSLQGDKAILDILRTFGAHVCVDKNDSNDSDYCDIKVSAGELVAHEVDIADCPDLGPVLMVLAAFSSGETVIINAARLRLKECDRIAAMEEELTKLNVDISSNKDTVTISGRRSLTNPVTVSSHNDHRIAMSLSVFAACCEQCVTIEDAQCVNKSYPNFYEDFESIRKK